MKNISTPLLNWYSHYKRDLPWRHTKDPYKIWLCEIIMQQTRVSQGLSYYNKFVEKFPSPSALAKASEDEVLKLWQGLGYYSRARNLHAAAKSMKGKFPSTYEGVRALKGVGDYTAAAICSIAYNMPYAVVDGTVYRVLSRVFGIDTPIDSTEGKKQFAQLAQEQLDQKHASDYNQAIMDFGATVCTPQTPQCAGCPLSKQCIARRDNRAEELPVKEKKTKISTRYFHYIYAVQGDFIYLHKRGAGDIWQNLYELPLIETPTEEKPKVAWLKGAKLAEAGTLKHVLSHQVIYGTIYKVQLPPLAKLPSEFIKIKKGNLKKYAIPRLVQKLLEKIKTEK